ncbi:vancomycin resistance protein W [Clostridium sp. HMP27]|nr:vancomycin resistance protein W [Clostridium sp. HMP27]
MIHVEKKKKKRKKKKALILILLFSVITVAGIVSAGISYMYNTVKAYEGLIYPGVVVGKTDLSKKTSEEAKKILKSEYLDKIVTKELSINTPGKKYTIKFGEIGAKFDLDKATNEALNYGKNLNLISKYKLIKNPVQKNVNLDFSYNDKNIKSFIANIGKEINKEPINAKLTKVGGFSVSEHQSGRKLTSDKLQKDVSSKINGEIGVNIEIEAPIEEIKPTITSDKLRLVNTRISSFSTNYGAISSPQRANNIQRATQSINGTVLMPGDTFSFNGVVGERTVARGYQAAGVIVGNQVESGLGGGICQVSSTLYNAILRANLKSTERAHHTLPSSYVPLGRDATVDWGTIDYKFKNTLNYPIYIEAYTAGGNVAFNVYSNNQLTSRSYDITSEIYETIPSTTQTVQDASLPEGEQQVTQKAYTGYKVRVYQNTYENGSVINKELISNDFYRPVNGIIKVGTKKS